MQTITDVTYRGFKGLEETTQVAPCTLLVGGNGTGKTARQDGLQFAVTGTTSLGGRADDTMKLLGHKGGSVGVSLNDGFSWRRSLTKDHKTQKVSSEINITGQEGLGVKKSEASVREHVGDFAPMFDLGAFLGLSPDKRRDFVLSLCAKHGAGGAVDATTLMQRITVEFLKDELGPGTVAEAAAGRFGTTTDELIDSGKGNELIEVLTASLADVTADCLAEATVEIEAELKGDLTSAIAAALDKARELVNASKARHNSSQQAARKLSEERAELKTVSDSVEKLSEQITEQQAEKEKIAEMIGNATGRAKSIEAEQATIERLTKVIADVEAAMKTAEAETDVPTVEQAEAVEKQADEINSTEPDQSHVTAAEQKVERLRATDAEASQALSLAEAGLVRCSEELARLNSEIDTLQSDDWLKAAEFAQALSTYNAIKTDDIRLVDIWTELLELLRRNSTREELDAKIQTRTEIDAKLQEGQSRHATAKESAEAASTALQEASQYLSDCRVEYNKAVDQHRNATAQAEKLRKDAAALREKISKREDLQKARQKTLTQARTESLEAQTRLDKLRSEGAAVSVEDLEKQRANITELIGTLTQHVKDKERYQALDHELQKCIASSERDDVLHTVCTQIGTAIRALRETLMEDLVRPLNARIDAFLAIAKPNTRTYCELTTDRGQPAFELGWIIDDIRKVPLPAMSGGEAALFCTGLAYALVALSDAPLKLLMLKAAELDATHLERVLQALADLSGDLSNVIVETCHWPMPITVPDAFVVTDVGQSRELAAA